MNILLSISGVAVGLIVGWNITSLVIRIVGFDSRLRFWLGLMTLLLMVLGGIWGYRLP